MLNNNKAGFACGWVGVMIKKAEPNIWARAVVRKPLVNAKKANCDRMMDIAGCKVVISKARD